VGRGSAPWGGPPGAVGAMRAACLHPHMSVVEEEELAAFNGRGAHALCWGLGAP